MKRESNAMLVGGGRRETERQQISQFSMQAQTWPPDTENVLTCEMLPANCSGKGTERCVCMRETEGENHRAEHSERECVWMGRAWPGQH